MDVFKIAFDKFVNVIEILIIARIFASFLVRDTSHPIAKFLYQITEPILSPIRHLIKKLGINTGMFDFAPLIAFIFLRFLSILVYSL